MAAQDNIKSLKPKPIDGFERSKAGCARGRERLWNARATCHMANQQPQALDAKRNVGSMPSVFQSENPETTAP